jgi:hypothetical protein
MIQELSEINDPVDLNAFESELITVALGVYH